MVLSFCFDREDTGSILNTSDSVSSAIQTPRIQLKILCCASYFQLSSQCLDILMKHCLSCLIYYMKTCTFLRITKCKSSLEKIIMYGPNLIYYMYVPLSVILKTFEVSFSSSNSSFKVLYSCILFAQEIRQILMKLS